MGENDDPKAKDATLEITAAGTYACDSNGDNGTIFAAQGRWRMVSRSKDLSVGGNYRINDSGGLTLFGPSSDSTWTKAKSAPVHSEDKSTLVADKLWKSPIPTARKSRPRFRKRRRNPSLSISPKKRISTGWQA